MGVTIRLHQLPRDRFDEATRRVQAAVAARDTAAITELIEQSHDGEHGEYLLELWRDAVKNGDTEECLPHILNSSFAQLATSRVFDLDKSARKLQDVLGTFTETRPLLALLRPEGMDVDLPDVAAPDDSGLFGAWSSRALAGCVEPAERFATREAVEALMEQGGLLDRLLGARRRREAVALWTSDAVWDHWTDLGEAVRTTVAVDAYLGWFLSA
jgi:hypothetical protein